MNCWSSIREFWGREESVTRVEVEEEREEEGRYSGAGIMEGVGGDGYILFMEGHRFSVLCFSAVSTIFRITNIPFRVLTRSIYPFATLSRSAFSPSSSSSDSVLGTQNGSSSSGTYLSLTVRQHAYTSHSTHPLKTSCGLAPPDVRFLMSDQSVSPSPGSRALTYRPQIQNSPQPEEAPSR